MLSRTTKLTSRNQLTLPKAVVEELGWPRHFRVQVAKGALVLWPGQTLAGPDLAVERIAREQRAHRRRGARDDGLSGTERPER